MIVTFKFFLSLSSSSLWWQVIPTVHNKAKKITSNQDQDTQEKKEKVT